MARPKAIFKDVWGNRLKELCEKEHITQSDLSDSIYISQQTISKIINHKASMTEETARRISEKYPEYSFEWLMGYVDYKNEMEHFGQAITEAQDKAHILWTGLLAFVKLSDFEINFASPLPKSNGGRHKVEDAIKMVRDGYVVRRGKQKGYISLEKMSLLQNEICDFIEFKLNKLLESGEDHG